MWWRVLLAYKYNVQMYNANSTSLTVTSLFTSLYKRCNINENFILTAPLQQPRDMLSHF